MSLVVCSRPMLYKIVSDCSGFADALHMSPVKLNLHDVVTVTNDRELVYVLFNKNVYLWMAAYERKNSLIFVPMRVTQIIPH